MLVDVPFDPGPCCQLLRTLTSGFCCYCFAGLCQYYSGFQHIGHNDWVTLILVWIIPKYVMQYPRRVSTRASEGGSVELICGSSVPWLIVPAYMVYVSGVEIFDGLVMASGGSGTRAGSTTKDD